MRIPVNRVHGTLEFNMTPMIDVTFLLIIFFLLANHFNQQETQVDLALPTASSGQQPKEDQTRRLTINVLEDGRLLLGGQELDSDELDRRIEVESRHAQLPDQQLEVRIRSDRRVAYRFVEPIMLTCARHGIWKVTFSVVRDEG